MQTKRIITKRFSGSDMKWLFKPFVQKHQDYYGRSKVSVQGKDGLTTGDPATHDPCAQNDRP